MVQRQYNGTLLHFQAKTNHVSCAFLRHLEQLLPERLFDGAVDKEANGEAEMPHEAPYCQYVECLISFSGQPGLERRSQTAQCFLHTPSTSLAAPA